MTAEIHSLADHRARKSGPDYRPFDPGLHALLADFLPRRKPRRGERQARWMLRQLDLAGVPFEVVRSDHGDWGICFPTWDSMTQQQREVAQTAGYFAVGYPGCFRTMIKIAEEKRSTSKGAGR